MEREDLPQDLIEEIFARVPAKSLLRFRSISKQWNALLKSGSFANKHTACARMEEESLIIMLIDYRVFLVRINLHEFHNNIAPSVKVAYQFNLNSSQVDIYNVFHCDGLLLCTTKDKRLVVWNPCSGETKWVKPRDWIYKESDYYALGYDNKSSCKQYKILRVDRQQILPINNRYEIYDFTSNSWRVLGVATDWFLGELRRGISVQGNTYWVATKTGMPPHADFLLGFDFSTERFQSLSLPLPYGVSALSVVREDQLCLLGTTRCTASSRDLDVWVTTNPQSAMSWRKFLTVKASPELNLTGLSFLVDEQNKTVVYNHYSNHNKILHIVRGHKGIRVDPLGRDPTTKPSSCPFLLNYVPSLALIRNNTLLRGRKRKKQSM